MSLLWRESYQVGLFPGNVGINARRSKVSKTVKSDALDDSHAWLDALESILEAEKKTLTAKSVVDVTVSDSIAAVIALPWQPSLKSNDELRNFAQVCFEKSGVSIGNGWTMHVEYRRFESLGLGYALPVTWIEELVALLQKYELRLRSVLPLSAAVYCSLGRSYYAQDSLILLEDQSGFSALKIGISGLQEYDTEPAIGSADESGTRMLKRLSAGGGKVELVGYWSPDLPRNAKPPGFVTACLPGKAVYALDRDMWES